MKKVLVATDGSEHAEKALRWALDYGRRCGAELHVVTVVPALTPIPGSPGIPVYDRYMEAALAEAERLLAGIRERLAEGGAAVQVHSGTGRPSQEILRTAESIGADLIVIGSRGLSRLEGAILGSVSTEVVHLSRFPVVVVR